jgi:general secretion pathway protein A
MYTDYYGLSKNPFDLTPDPGVVFMSDSHKEALAILHYGVVERKGFLLLTGGVGTGKTTLLHLLIRSLGEKVHYCLISNPSLAINDLYYILAHDFSLSPYTNRKAKFLQEFTAFLEECRQRKERVLLIIDEAHVLSVKLLEEVRLLSNQGGQHSGILSIFLVGQPELNRHLGDARLLPLRQRIAIRFHLDPFDRDATASYINFRLRLAGAQRFDFFTAKAIDLIHEASLGVPRLINILCDQTLLTGFAESHPSIDAAMVRDCVRELHIPGEAGLLPLSRIQALMQRLSVWSRSKVF